MSGIPLKDWESNFYPQEMTQTKIGVLPHCCSMPFKTQGQQTIENPKPQSNYHASLSLTPSKFDWKHWKQIKVGYCKPNGPNKLDMKPLRGIYPPIMKVDKGSQGRGSVLHLYDYRGKDRLICYIKEILISVCDIILELDTPKANPWSFPSHNSSQTKWITQITRVIPNHHTDCWK